MLGVYRTKEPALTTVPCAGVAMLTMLNGSPSGSKSLAVTNTFTVVAASVRATSARATGGDAANAVESEGKVTARRGTKPASARTAITHAPAGALTRLARDPRLIARMDFSHPSPRFIANLLTKFAAVNGDGHAIPAAQRRFSLVAIPQPQWVTESRNITHLGDSADPRCQCRPDDGYRRCWGDGKSWIDVRR